MMWARKQYSTNSIMVAAAVVVLYSIIIQQYDGYDDGYDDGYYCIIVHVQYLVKYVQSNCYKLKYRSNVIMK